VERLPIAIKLAVATNKTRDAAGGARASSVQGAIRLEVMASAMVGESLGWRLWTGEGAANDLRGCVREKARAA